MTTTTRVRSHHGPGQLRKLLCCNQRLRMQHQVILALAVFGVLLACNMETVTQPVLEPPETMLGQMEISPAVSIIAVGGTLQLGVTGRSLTGTPIDSFDSVTFALQTPADTLRVRLTSSGQVTGLAPSSGPMHVQVNVYAYKGNAARAARALVQITPAIVPGTVLSIQPVSPDSAKLAQGITKTIIPVLRNPTTGAQVASPVVWYTVRPEDETRVGRHQPRLAIPGGAPNQINPSPNPAPSQIRASAGDGTVWIYARINVYGTTLTDSVLYTLTYPYALTIATEKANLKVTSPTAANQTYNLAPGATITFRNGVAASDPLRITYSFDNPSAATASSPLPAAGGTTGNLTPLSGGQSSTRKFLTPGTYRWTATASGGPEPWPGQTVTGTIVIK